MAPMTGRIPSQGEECFKSAPKDSLSQKLASLSVTSTERNSHIQHRRASQSQTVASLRNQPTRPPKLHLKQRSMRNNIQEASFSGRVAMPAPSRLGRNVTAGSSSSEGAELEWLPSTNSGSSEISIRVTAQLLITPKSTYSVRDMARNHNSEVSKLFPRMRFRELGESECPDLWELIPLEEGLRLLAPGSTLLTDKYQLKSPCIKISKPLTIKYRQGTPSLKSSESWQDYFEATGNYLQKNYTIQGINGFLPAISISVSTFERRLDFKRIVQALIHFNPLWPKVLPCDDIDPNEAAPRIVVGKSYLSHHPDHWCAVPTTGDVVFYIRQASEVGAKSVLWSQFVVNFILAATESPSLEFIQSYPATIDDLNAFILGGPPKGNTGRSIKSLW